MIHGRGPLASPGQRGFTILEVLVAMALFVVGFILVASIFPVSAMLQKEATNLVRGQQAARSARGMLRGRGLQEAELMHATYGLPASADTDRRVYPLPNVTGYEFLPATGRETAPTNWALADRSFPTNITDPTFRDLYWVPLVRDTDGNAGEGNRNWEVYVFILKREDRSTYPKPVLASPDKWANPNDPAGTSSPAFTPGVPGIRSVRVAPSSVDGTQFIFQTTGFNTNSDIQAGDLVLDNYGYVYRVVEHHPNWFKVSGYIFPNPQTGSYPDTIWYAKPPRPGYATPTLDILVLTGVVR